MTTTAKTILAAEQMSKSEGFFARMRAWMPDVGMLPVLAAAVVQIACIGQFV